MSRVVVVAHYNIIALIATRVGLTNIFTNMKRFQVTSVDQETNNGPKNEVQINACNLFSQSNGNNGKITNSDVESSRKFSFAQLTR